jgi:ketosteroid isomerase-like protein
MNTETRITECEEQLLSAVRNHDADALAALLHDALLFHLPNGQAATKAMDIEAYRSGHMKVEHISATERVIHALDDTAVVSVLVALKGKYFNDPIDGHFRYLRVWKQVEGTWQIIAGSCIQLQVD